MDELQIEFLRIDIKHLAKFVTEINDLPCSDQGLMTRAIHLAYVKSRIDGIRDAFNVRFPKVGE